MKLVGYLVPFALVLYLGLGEGGYEPRVHEEVGIACAWALLLGLLAGVGPRPRLPRTALVALGALLALAAWTALALLWSESAGRTAIELARLLSYASIFALALLLVAADPGGSRRVLGGVAAAIVVIGLLALLSRLQPSWFGPNELAATLPDVRSRLAYPLGYWNALAALIAVGLPLVWWHLGLGGARALRLAAAAVTPALLLALYLTFSRAGIAAAMLGLTVMAALHPLRAALLPALAVSGVGGGVLVWAASRRQALSDGLEDAAANSQGDELSAIVLAVGALAALAQYAYERGSMAGRIPQPRELRLPIGRRSVAAGAIVVVLAAVALGAPARVADGFDRFREPVTPADDSSRLSSASGNGRWQYWTAAVQAGASEPVLGIGPGAYEFYWQREGELEGFIRDAHSLYLEAFGEMGLVGFSLLVGLSVLVLWVGVRHSRARAAPRGRRATMAAATGAATAFVASAATDWTWEMAVVPAAFLFVAAAILGRRAPGSVAPNRSEGRIGTGAGLGLAAALIVAIVVIGLPYASQQEIAESQDAFRAADYERALDDAEGAESLQPFAAPPRLQQALVYEAEGQLERATRAAREAIDREKTNWEHRLVLSRLLAARGRDRGAAAAFSEAQRLNPSSPFLYEAPR